MNARVNAMDAAPSCSRLVSPLSGRKVDEACIASRDSHLAIVSMTPGKAFNLGDLPKSEVASEVMLTAHNSLKTLPH